MLKSYLKTAFRNLFRNKTFSFINIFGLAIGITVCMLIYLFIINEFNFDKFHKDNERLYRVMRSFKSDGSTKQVAYLSGLYGPALKNDFGNEVESMVRVINNNNLVTLGDKSYNEKKVLDVDSNFFTFFSFPLKLGEAGTALSDPGSIVLTESSAKKYFGSAQNAMGKILTLDKEMPLKVTAIAKDVPANSTIDFDMVVPIENYKDEGIMKVWISNGLFTYVKLAPHVIAKNMESRFPAFMDKYMGSDMRKFGFDFNLFLMPLRDVHFANDAFDNSRHGDKTIVFIFLSVAILILVIACINFMNLSTIRAMERSKEVGMRKVLGAVRGQLVYQFLGESVLITSIACLLAVALIFLGRPWYAGLLNYDLAISWNQPGLWIFLGGVIVFVGLVAGCYPAFVLSAFKPIQALKGKLRLGKSGTYFRHALVVLQFSISVFLITSVIVIQRQMNYVKNKSLGYSREQLLIVPFDNAEIYKNRTLFKNLVQAENGIQSVSLMSGEPGGFFDSFMFDVEGKEGKQNAHTEFADFQVVSTLGLQIIAGRDFSASFATDSSSAVLVNKSFAKSMGWTPEQALGKWIQNTVRDTAHRTIIGVVADFNFQSLKSEIAPLVIAPNRDWRTAVIKLASGNIAQSVASVKKDYAQAAPGYPVEFIFMDEQFDKMYKKDIQQQKILSSFAALAIFVACLGLFGLASFTTGKRVKEIGVRKVLGSSVRDIVVLLSKDLMKPVLIATCIAIPFGYWAMSKWLENFAYKIALSTWIFILAAIITFAIAFATVAIKAVKAAMANPAKSLKSE